MTADKVVNVVSSVFNVCGFLSPHALVLVRLHILSHFGVSVAGNRLKLCSAKNVKNKVEEMYTPVNKHTAARLLLGGKRAAKTWDRTETSERAVNVINLAKLALSVHLLKHFNRLVIAIANTNVEHLALLFGFLSHLTRKLVVYRNGLFAENVLARAERVHSNGVVRVVGGENVNRLNLAVRKRNFVIGDSVFNIRVFFLCGVRLFLDNVTSVFYANVVHLIKSREVRVVGNSSTAYNCNNRLFHKKSFPRPVDVAKLS